MANQDVSISTVLSFSSPSLKTNLFVLSSSATARASVLVSVQRGFDSFLETCLVRLEHHNGYLKRIYLPANTQEAQFLLDNGMIRPGCRHPSSLIQPLLYLFLNANDIVLVVFFPHLLPCFTISVLLSPSRARH